MKNTIFALALVGMLPYASSGYTSSDKSIEDTLVFLKSIGSVPMESTVEDSSSVTSISIYVERVTDKVKDEVFAYLIPLCKLEKIKDLDFRFNRITGAGLKMVAEKCGTWKSVRSIDLGGNPLVDDYLKELNAFPNLETLNIDFHDEGAKSAVDGSFLKEIRLPKLISFWATGTSFSEANALLILNLPALEIFCFGQFTTLSSEVLEKLHVSKINMAKKTWDLRRIKYEEKVGQCYSEVSDSEHAENLEFGISNALITEEAATHIKASDLKYQGWQDHKGRVFSMICKSTLTTGSDEL